MGLNMENRNENTNLTRKNSKCEQDKSKYKLALEAAGLGTWDWNIETGKVVYNDTFLEMLGYSMKDFESTEEIWDKITHPEDLKRASQAMELHFRGSTNRFQSEYRVRTKTGNWKWIQAVGQVVERSEDGKPLRAVGVHKDIDRSKMAELEVEKHRAFFEELFDGSPAGIALLDSQERIIRINPSFKKMFGYQQSDVEGRYLNDLIVPEDIKEEGEELTRKATGGETVVIETVRRTSSDERLNVMVFGYPVKMQDEVLGIFAVYQDITARKQEEEEIKYLSFHDQLTGLYNRRYFEAELERLDKSRRLPIGIIVADLDYLKYVNDDFGHKSGDKYIQDAAKAIKEVLREDDIACRIGGDEFAIILPEVDENILKEVSLRIGERYKKIGHKIEGIYHISLGFALKKNASQTLEEIFTVADRRMYINKENYKASHIGCPVNYNKHNK